MAEISIVIPSRGRTEFLRSCLDSLEGDVDIVVVEQGDLSKEMLDERSIHRIEISTEASYSEMNNAGVAETSSEFILFLNNDVEAKGPFIDKMLDEFSDESVGIVGARLFFPDGTLQHCGIKINSEGVPFHPNIRGKDHGLEYTDAVTFACAMIRRKVWDDVGGLDTDYFFNYEDVDFCLSAKKKGWKIRMSKAVLIHHSCASASFRRTMKHSREHNYRIFRKKWIEDA